MKLAENQEPTLKPFSNRIWNLHLQLKCIHWFQRYFRLCHHLFILFHYAFKRDTSLALFPVIIWSTASYKEAFVLLFASFLSGLISSLLKHTFQTPRPRWVDSSIRSFPNLKESSYATPSLHSSQAWSLATVFILNNLQTPQITLFACYMASMVSISRLYLGFHYLQDIILGALIGILATLLGFSIFETGFLNISSSEFLLYSGWLLLAGSLFIACLIFHLQQSDVSQHYKHHTGLFVEPKSGRKFIYNNFGYAGMLTGLSLTLSYGLSLDVRDWTITTLSILLSCVIYIINRVVKNQIIFKHKKHRIDSLTFQVIYALFIYVLTNITAFGSAYLVNLIHQ